MSSVLAAAPAGIGLSEAPFSYGVAMPETEDGALVGRICRSGGLYFDLMEITTIMHRTPGGGRLSEPAENELPVTSRRR
ncbi:hypothetical protein [Gordonia terrae]|nr:hypothetical protein [Gordonia terrae]